MKTMIQAAVVTLFASSIAHAQQAVQWRVEDGGNGHWYEGRRLSTASPVSWGSARITALSSGGDLVSLNTPQESAWVFANIASTPSLWSLSCGPWIGAAQLPGSHEPSAGWTWVDSTSLDPSFPWTPAHQPDNATYCGGSEDYACYWYGEGTPQPANRFADLVESGYCIVRPKGDWVTSAVIEWSADCNSDGIVDYGQILQGQLADTNGNGIPDGCEVPTCVDADLFRDFNVNGADLGILLSQWGPNTTLTVSDLNGDGGVDGADLGLFLSFWGACP